MKITKGQLELVKKIDLLTYLMNYEPDELIKNGRCDYVTRAHESLHISNGLWMWWSRSIGGRSALDYLIKVEDMEFINAANMILDKITASPPVIKKIYNKKQKAFEFRKPIANDNEDIIINYLVKERCIDQEIVNYYIMKGYVYETKKDHSVVFVGYDCEGIARFACTRETNGKRKKDVAGSNKSFSFSHANSHSDVLYVFESAIDLMSFQSLEKSRYKPWLNHNYLSLSGASTVGDDLSDTTIPPALSQFLDNNKQINHIYLHLDNDRAGHDTVKKIKYHLDNRYDIHNKILKEYKDVNEYLKKKLKMSLSSAVR